ncbi:MAG: hypothetical protein HRU29_08685 [Rhizobiales bacterium]|nr:hypothetical protein [Hyphomicrobiales bacterium]NRB14463.1 hypothetical protein [Hyphomicrobiales bacterium]
MLPMVYDGHVGKFSVGLHLRPYWGFKKFYIVANAPNGVAGIMHRSPANKQR